MKKFFAVLAVFFLCFGTAFAQIGGGGLSPASAASQAEVNAGTIPNKYVSPLTLAGSNGGTNNVTKTGNSTISGIVTATNTGNSFSGTFSGTFPTNILTTNELDPTYFLINTTNQIVASNFTPFTNGPTFQVSGVYTWNSGFSWKSLAGNTLTGAYTNGGLNVFWGVDPDNSGVWIVSLSSRSMTGYTNGYYYNTAAGNITGSEWDYKNIAGRVDDTAVTGALVGFQGLVISNKKADTVPASGVQSGNLPATATNTAPLIGSAAQLTNGLFTAMIYVNSNRVVSASESNAMFTTNIVFYLDSTSSNLLFTFPSPSASANVSFSVINGGTNSVTLTNATGNTFKVANGYFSGFSNSFVLGGYFDKSQTWINLNSTNWMMVIHSRTLQELQDVARNATGATNGSISTATTSTNDSAGRNISTLSRTNEPNSVTFTNAGNLISFNQSVLLTQANTNLVIDGTGYPNHMMFSVTCTNNLFVRLTNWATDSEITLKVFQGTGLTNAISYLTNASTTSPFTRAPFFYTLPTNTANSVLVNKWIFTTTTNSDLMGQVPIQ